MYFGRVRAQRMPASPMRARLSRTGTGHRPQMHADECAADVNARARADVLHQYGVRHVRICGGGKGTARVGLRHGVYRFRPRRKRRRSTTMARFRCSQHCAARYNPLSASRGAAPSHTACAPAMLEPRPMRWPTTSLDEQPMIKYLPRASGLPPEAPPRPVAFGHARSPSKSFQFPPGPRVAAHRAFFFIVILLRPPIQVPLEMRWF